MLTLFAVAWFVSGLVCLADILDRRAERRRRIVNVVQFPPQTKHVRIIKDGEAS